MLSSIIKCRINKSKAILKTNTYPYHYLSYLEIFRTYLYNNLQLNLISETHPQIQFKNFISSTYYDYNLLFTNASKSTMYVHSTYFKIRPYLPPRPWYSEDRYILYYPAVLIPRLHFNHNRIPANLARFIFDISPICTHHLDDPQSATLTYILFTYPTIERERNTLENKLLKLQIPRPWSHISLFYNPTTPVVKALYNFFRSIEDISPI